MNKYQNYKNIEAQTYSPSSSDQKDEIFKLNDALNNGWNILEATNMLAAGKNNENRSFVLTLFNANKMLTKEVYLSDNEFSAALLKKYQVPGVYSPN